MTLLRPLGRLLLHASLALPCAAGAQTADSTAPLDARLAPLPKGKMQTLILYDRVYKYAQLDQPAPATGRATSQEHYRQAVFELAHASYDTGMAVRLAGLRQNLLHWKYLGRTAVPLAVLDARFDRIKPYALDSGLVEFGPDSSLQLTSSSASRSAAGTLQLYDQLRATLVTPLAKNDQVSG